MPGTYQYDVEIKSNVAKLLSDMKQVQDRLDTVEGREYTIKLNIDEKKLSNVISNLEKMLDSLGKGTGDFKQFENLSKELSSIVLEVQSLSKAFGKVDDSGAKTLLSSIQNIDKSLSELSQNILNVNKNMSNMGGNTSGTVKQVENITNESKKAASALEDVAKAQEKVNGQKTNISSGLDSSISKYQEIVSLVKEYYELSQKLESPKLSYQKRSEDYDKIDAYLLSKKSSHNIVAGQNKSKDDREKNINDTYHDMSKGINEGKDFAVKAMKSAIQSYWSNVTEMPSDDKLLSSRKIDRSYKGSSKEEYIIPKKYQDMERSVIQETIAMNKNNIAYEEERKQIEANNSVLKERMNLIRNTIKGYDKNPDYNGEYRMGLSLKSSDKGKTDIFSATSSMSQEEMLQEICNMLGVEIPKNANKAKEAIKEVTSAAATTEPTKDAFQGNGIDNSKEQLAIDKQLTKELESQAKAQQKKWQSFQKENENYQKKQSEVEAVKCNKDAYEELANAIKQYSEVSKRISGGKAEDGDIEKMTQLEGKISQLQKQPILSDSQVAKSESALVSLYDQLDKIEKKLQETNQKQVDSGFSKLSTYQGKVDKYQATINRFNDGGWTSDTYLENVKAVENTVKRYETLLNELKGKDASLVTSDDISKLDEYEKKIKDTIATVTNMSASEKGYNFVSGQKELDKIHKLLAENSKMSSEAKAKIQAYYREIESGNPSMSLDKIHGEILKIYNAEVEAGRAGRTLWDTLKNSGFHQIAAQMAGMFGVYDVINLGKEGFNVVRELNTALTEMRKVSDETVQSLKDYQATTFDTADAVGTTAKQIQNSTADWMRLGESMNQAAESAKDANVLLNVSEFEGIDEATESLVSMSQAYKDLDKMDIIDVLNNIGNNYSISTDGLATALKDSASALVTANNNLNEAVSLTTAGNAITQDPSKVGAGLRTISLRLVGTEQAKQELSDLGEETDGMITTVSKLRDTIMDATKAASKDGKGFDILDDNGNYKSTYEIMQGLADLYNDIVKKDKELGTNNLNLLLETIAGKNRSNIAASILQNGDMLRSVYEDAQNSDGSAEQELNSYLDSIDGKMAQLENRAQEFWFKVIDSETIKNGISLLSTLLKGATDFVDTVGLLPTILAPIVAILGKGKSSQRFCPIW